MSGEREVAKGYRKRISISVEKKSEDNGVTKIKGGRVSRWKRVVVSNAENSLVQTVTKI